MNFEELRCFGALVQIQRFAEIYFSILEQSDKGGTGYVRCAERRQDEVVQVALGGLTKYQYKCTTSTELGCLDGVLDRVF